MTLWAYAFWNLPFYPVPPNRLVPLILGAGDGGGVGSKG